jgi:hypothetical protein
MNKLWIPPQAVRYTRDDLVAAAKALGCKNVTPRTVRRYVEHGLLDHPHRQWPGWGGGSTDGWWPHSQFALWRTEILQCVRLAQREGRNCLIYPGLYNAPVWGWLYAGESSGVRLPQVQRAMASWARDVATARSFNQAQREAKAFVSTFAHPRAESRLDLRREFAQLIFTGEYSDQEVLLYHLQQLLDPLDRGDFIGAADAPFTAENLRDIIVGRAAILRQLQDNPANIADGIWAWARFVSLWSRGWYQQAQPTLAAAAAVQSSRASSQLYRVENEETLANASCVDLLTILALAPHAERASHLAPEFTPAPWLAGRVDLAVEVHQEASPILLPNGMQTIYAVHTVRLNWAG